MTPLFPRIGLFSKPTGEDIAGTLNHVATYLHNRKHEVFVELSSAPLLTNTANIKTLPSEQIGAQCNLIIVIGGDGSLLKASRAIVDNKIPIIGVNRGNLGFLADINPNDIDATLDLILSGSYVQEERTMLQALIVQEARVVSTHLALNDVVLHHGDIARLIEFEIFIDDQFVVDHRADGLVTATPTGSTAYSLSGGGPIVYPDLDVLTLLPMFPHTLSARPLVVHKNSKIRLVMSASNRNEAKISCDGQSHMALKAGDEIHIQAHANNLRLLHPKNYNYYSVLREKLGWNINLTK